MSGNVIPLPPPAVYPPEQTVRMIYPVERTAKRAPQPPKVEAQSMWYYKEIDIGSLFPLSHLFSLRRSFVWAIAAAGLWVLYHFSRHHEFVNLGLDGTYVQLPELLAVGVTVILLARLIYYEIYRYTYRFSIDGFRFVISRGVLFRERGSLPILPVSEIYIRRNFADYLLGLADIQIVTPLDASHRFASIEGFPVGHAYALQQFLSDQLNRQIFLADIPQRNKETGEETTYRTFYTSKGPGGGGGSGSRSSWCSAVEQEDDGPAL